jgi:hypothetical protein
MARPTPFLSQSDCEVLACADCAARLANGEPVPMYGIGWPLSLRCEHERESDIAPPTSPLDDLREWHARQMDDLTQQLADATACVEGVRAMLRDDDPECPDALHPVNTLAALADYAEQQAFAHAGETDDPDAIHEMIRDGIAVVRQLQDFAFGVTKPHV